MSLSRPLTPGLSEEVEVDAEAPGAGAEEGGWEGAVGGGAVGGGRGGWRCFPARLALACKQRW